MPRRPKDSPPQEPHEIIDDQARRIERLEEDLQRSEIERNRLRREHERLNEELEMARRRANRQAAPFSRGLPPPETTVYAIEDGRGFAQAARMRGADYAGVLQRDGWAPYRQFTQAAHQTCLAPLLRRCRTIMLDHPDHPCAPRVQTLLHAALATRDRQHAGHVSAHGLAVARGVRPPAYGDHPHDVWRRQAHPAWPRHDHHPRHRTPGTEAHRLGGLAVRPSLTPRSARARLHR